VTWVGEKQKGIEISHVPMMVTARHSLHTGKRNCSGILNKTERDRTTAMVINLEEQRDYRKRVGREDILHPGSHVSCS
jgi:hypothetical protein